MTDDPRDQRLAGASELAAAIDALLKVPPKHRLEYLHDRLASTIDDSCKRNGVGGKSAFTQAQATVLKDVSFYIVHVLDSKGRPRKGFFPALLVEWREKTPMGKVGVAFATFTAIATILGSSIYGWNTYLQPLLSRHTAAILDDTKPGKAAPSDKIILSPVPAIPGNSVTFSQSKNSASPAP